MNIQSDLRAELRRREARSSLQTWCELALEASGQFPAAHHRLLIGELEAIARGENDRLMIFWPPGSAKSTYASVLFACWFLAQAERLSIIAGSHTSDLAEAFSRRVMTLIREHSDTLGYSLATESVSGWETSTGGSYRAAGVGGPITGRRADLAIIDDPVKSRAQADSPGERERVWAWFLSDLRTRLRPGAKIVLIMTRWHEDDLGGRLLQAQPDRWKVLKLPAQAEENDPLGRKPGEFLWSDGPYGFAGELQSVLRDYETSGGMRDWAALYQQTPRAAEGSLFKVAMIPVIDSAPPAERAIRAWDLAATRAIGSRQADWSVGLLLTRSRTGSYVVADIVRLRGGPDEIEAAILSTARRDGKDVEISLAQDPGQAGKWQVQNLVKMLAGFNVTTSPESGDKATRASPVASQINVGNVSIVAAGWNPAFIDELSGFPSTRWDDQVDALSRAFNTLTPMLKGGAMLELARRQLAAMDGRKAEPESEAPANPYQPGCAEWQRRQAELDGGSQ